MKKVRQQNSTLSFYSSKLYTRPTNFQFTKLFIKHCFRLFKRYSFRLFNYEPWILLYSFNNKPKVSTSIFRYKRITPPKDRFWADPFVIFDEGKYYIFLEELIYKKNDGKAHISVMEISNDGAYSEPQIIIKKPYHLSYPFVFKHEGVYYLIPESLENGTIELYQATNFPYEWEFKMNLMENISAVDTTILFKDNKFWLFTNIIQRERYNASEELFLFSSDVLLTNNWKSHPQNPIVSDVKTARPAGKIFYYENKLYRPSQDCSYMYGFSTNINEIIILNENEYKEKKVSNILPNWAKDVVGTHTLSFENNLTVIDAQIKRRKWG